MAIDPKRVKQIFLEAAELADEAARAAHLDKACGGDAGLRGRVEALLRSHDPEGSFLGAPAAVIPEPEPAATQAVSSSSEAMSASHGSTTTSPDEESLAFLAPSTRPDALGRIGHYDVLQVLGRGGFGIVFRAFDDVLQRVVAVKVLAPQLAATSPARKRFLREARTSGAIRHENVVQVYEVGEQPLPYLVMEFIPGETLQQRLDRIGPVEPAEVVRVGRQIAEGLAAAHATDLIHRDIKPGNILLEGGQHKVKITDFGLARAADDASISQSGIIAGTPMYMAPEQASGNKLDQRADLFSLGSVLYQMTAGRPPFRANSTVAVLKRVAEDTPRDIREIIPETPQWLCDIIAKLHAKNPDERYQSAREVADVLADCEAQLKANSKLKDFSRIPRGNTQPSGRRKWVAAAAVLLLPVIALVVTEFAGLTHLFRGQQPGSEPTVILEADRKAAEYVLSIGGAVRVNDQDRDLKAAADLPRGSFRLTGISLDNTMVSDVGLAYFKDCKNLTELWLTNTPVSDTGLAHFRDCKKLTSLSLHGTQVSDAGLAHFKDCKNLTHLYLSKTQVSEAGLASFKDCKNLTLLDLHQTRVSDAGLALFKSYKNLAHLALQKTKVTAAGIDELNKALPQCKITWDGSVIEPMAAIPPTFTNSIGMEFVIVPKGKSWLGGGKDKLGDQEVEMPADFYLGKYEVTQEEWEKVMGENPSSFSRTGTGADAVKDISDADLKRFPVEMVSWHQCQTFVEKLNKLENESGWVYRLPTEMEWEYACRGGPMADKPDSAFDFYFARPTNTLLLEQANFNKGLNRTCKVGSYAANRLGLFDMHGNVREWCDDPVSGLPVRRLKGGNWRDNSDGITAGHRYTTTTGFRGADCGLRVARVPSNAPSPEAKTPPIAVAPFTDADAQRIAALPAKEQVEEVRKELMRRNPDFDGQVGNHIEDGVVTELRINTDRVTDISPIRVFNALRVLDGTGTETNWRANGQLADLTPLKGMNLTGLTQINLRWTKVDDAGMACFKDSTNLVSLLLTGTQVRDSGLAHFKDCKDLTDLWLDGTKVSEAGLAYFKNCKKLSTLYLHVTNVGDAGLVHFKDCNDLTELWLGATKVSDAGLDYFKDCKNLTKLRLNSTKVSNAGLAYFKDCKNLTELFIDNTNITNLSLLKGMPLKELRCDFQPERDTEILRAIKTLEKINRKPAAEFWKDVEVWEANRKAAEYVLSIGGTVKVNDQKQEIKAAADLPRESFRLTSVSFRANNQVSDAGLAVFKDCKNLTYIDLYRTPVTDAGLANFKDCKNLTYLDLWETRVTDEGLAHFKDCKNLTGLGLSGTQITDAGLTHFKDCKSLTVLHLAGTQVSDAGLAHLKDRKNLTRLFLDSTQVTDAGLADLAGLATLTELNLANTKVTAKGVEGLAKALPKCKITWDGGVIEAK